MRTVDPALWSKKEVKQTVVVARPWRYRVDVATTFEWRMRQSFRDAMGEFLRNCSMKGVGCIFNRGNPKSIRRGYLLLVTSTLVCWLAVTACSVATLGGRPPLEVGVQSTLLPVHEVDFPAVALCSYNIISRSELHSYASYLYSLQKNNTYSMEKLKQNLLAFSGLIVTSPVDFDPYFTQYLAEVAGETNVTNIIYKLSPKCENMLVRCGWRGRRERCDRLFAMRLTDVGYCCVFNARFSEEDRNTPPYRVSSIGPYSGLSVVIKEKTDDFTLVRRTGEELEMLLFDGRQYPLMRAGVLRTHALQRNASAFVTLQANVQDVSESLRFNSEAWRGCVMPSLDRRRDPEHYWSQCVAECRRKAVRALCLCNPHTQPANSPYSQLGSNRSSDDLVCSLEHITCLNKYQAKLSLFYPGDSVDESLSEERADSVECLHCLPNCARLRYFARVWTLPYKNLLKGAFKNSFAKGLDIVNGTIVRIYFTTMYQQHYLVEPNLRPYEVIAFISSQWVFMAGISAITLLELIYHCTIRWHHHYRRRSRRDYDLPQLTECWQEKDFYGQ